MEPKEKQTRTMEGQIATDGAARAGSFLDAKSLHSAIKGRVIIPGEPGYDESRNLFYGGFDRRPAIVIRPADAVDVAAAVGFARELGIELAVRSGGHSLAGHSVSDGGMVIDMRDMRALQIDPQLRTAWAETGLTAGEYVSAAHAYGLATGFGDTGSVGIGGITLGGGIGYLVRKHGLTIDSLLAADIVTADGQVLRVDNENHPDLFWAIRGGGGNFGVATRFQYRLHEVSTVYGGMLVLPATPEVVAGFMAEADAAPEALSTIATIMPAPPMPFLPAEQHGKMIVMAMLVYSGPVEAGEKAVAPFRALAKPLADMLRPMPYPEMFPHEETGGYKPTAVGRTIMIDKIDQHDAETIVNTLQNSDAVMRVVQLRALGGAVSRVPAEATAFAHRHRKVMAGFYAFYTTPEDRLIRQAWIEEFTAALQQGEPAEYVNFMGEDGKERIRRAYPGQTWARLAEIKARYDPDNLFRLNQNIEPAMKG